MSTDDAPARHFRAQLDDLVSEPPQPRTDARRTLSAVRTRRRRGRVVLAAVAVVMAGSGAAVTLAALPDGNTPPPAAASPHPAPSVPSRSHDPAALQTGPSAPEIGRRYPYDLYTHCGIRYALFAGRWWETEALPPRTDDPAGGTYTGYTAGWMTLTSPDHARFEAPGLPAITFRPSTTAPPACA
ncbi:hypothetical protein [Streptomyces sp. NPDC091371]|uniref:hypothetical protein n=1 Tax=Streptomyces sp. NPDC091371 TaxID=3155303 RepID=UPI0034360898